MGKLTFGLDVETNTDYDKAGSLRSIQIYNPQKNRATVFHRTDAMFESNMWDVAHVMANDTVKRLDIQVHTDRIKEELQTPDRGYILHSGSFDLNCFQRDMGFTPELIGDSYLLSLLIPKKATIKNSLHALMREYVDENYDKYKYGSWEDFDWAQPLPDEALLYGGRDAFAGWRLEHELRKKFPKFANQVYDQECRLVHTLTRMRDLGLRVEKDAYPHMVEKYRVRIEKANKKLSEIRGSKLDVASRKDLNGYLFDELGLTPIVLTSTKKASTSMEALEALTHPVIGKILKVKEAIGVFNGIKNLRESPHEEDDKYLIFHPEFRPIAHSGAGRIYTSKPSANSWPWPLRGLVHPSKPDRQYYFCDVNAFEFIYVCHCAGQTDIIEDYLAGGDPIKTVATRMGVDRDTAKTTIYATFFGSEGQSISRDLGVSLSDAKALQIELMNSVPRVKALRDKIYDQCTKGVVRTTLGHHKALHSAFSSHQFKRNAAKRQGFSHYVQTGSAGIQKFILNRLDDQLPENHQLAFSVFDSFLIELPLDADIQAMDDLMSDLLEVPIGNQVWKFRFTSKVGPTWGLAKV